MSLLTTVLKSVVHAEQPRAEHVRDRIFHASGSYFFVPRGGDTGYRLQPGEAASIAHRADANLQAAQKLAKLAVFGSVVVAMLLWFAIPKHALPATRSDALFIFICAVAVVAGIFVHRRHLGNFDRLLESELNQHSKVPMDMLQDPVAASSSPRSIRTLMLCIMLPVIGFAFYTVTLPITESNKLMPKAAILIEMVHIPLALLGVFLAVRFYYMSRKRGF
jgi:hypothetical protein